VLFFFSSRRRHTRWPRDWSSDVCSSDLRRAREIAMIDERTPDEFTDADWSQAREELMGSENNEPPEETPDNSNVTGEWEVTPDRSEERRVGKERRGRRVRDACKRRVR